jgi:hypothetical protein
VSGVGCQNTRKQEEAQNSKYLKTLNISKRDARHWQMLVRRTYKPHPWLPSFLDLTALDLTALDKLLQVSDRIFKTA